MKVAEIMRTNLKTLRAEATVADAVAALTEAQVSALPVLDGHGRAVGVCSTRDVLVAESRYASAEGRAAVRARAGSRDHDAVAPHRSPGRGRTGGGAADAGRESAALLRPGPRETGGRYLPDRHRGGCCGDAGLIQSGDVRWLDGHRQDCARRATQHACRDPWRRRLIEDHAAAIADHQEIAGFSPGLIHLR